MIDYKSELTMKKLIFTGLALVLAACTTGTLTQEFASENGISLKYSAWDTVPTLTAEASDIATRHCATYGKFANYRGGNAVNALVSAEEVHKFACEKTKADDNAVIAAQSTRPDYVVVPVYSSPTQTSCTTAGASTNCVTY